MVWVKWSLYATSSLIAVFLVSVYLAAIIHVSVLGSVISECIMGMFAYKELQRMLNEKKAIAGESGDE